MYQKTFDGGDMKQILVLKNTVQEYGWGSYTAIPELLGLKSPADNPQAELWMGAHPKASSMIEYEGVYLSLEEMIKKYPVEILGEETAEKFNNRLPYLFKVLAAAKPLSIQAHPSLDQAKEGFERENRQAIPLDAPDRNYRDDNHKPECICALTDCWALNGFRAISEIHLLMEKITPIGLEHIIDDLKKEPDAEGLKHFFQSLMTLDQNRKQAAIEDAIEKAGGLTEESPVFNWMMKLYREYPEDIGIFAPIFLNLICLKPGQAMFLPAGELHAYLDGVVIELMANSDNVLRGGLTPKHVDVPELLKILNFEERNIEILESLKTGDCEGVYASSAREFVLSVIRVKEGRVYSGPRKRSVEILLCTEGDSVITDMALKEKIPFARGTSVIVPARAGQYTIEGNATLYKAAVPIRPV